LRRRSRPNPTSALPIRSRVPGSGTFSGGGGGGGGGGDVQPDVHVPGKNVSGPVPNEKVAAVTVVFAVTPDRARVNVAGPIVYGLKLSNPLFVLAKVPPFAMNGTIISLG